MKKKIIKWLPVILVGFLFSCNNQPSNAGVTAFKDTTNINANMNDKKVANDSNANKFDSTNMKMDAEFVVNALDDGMLEVQLGKLAQINASSTDVKNAAQKMVDDHSKANEQLKALAQKYNISVAATISDKNEKVYNKLSGITGKDFDKKYVDMMVSAHKGAIDAFKKEADNGNNNEIKEWAGKTLPTLQGHLQLWEDTQAKMKS